MSEQEIILKDALLKKHVTSVFVYFFRFCLELK